MDERVGPERREHAHVFLGVMESVKPPQRGEPVVGNMRAPVHRVDPDEHGHNDDNLRDHWQPVQDQERGVPLDFDGKARLDKGQDRDDDNPREHKVGRVDDMGRASTGLRTAGQRCSQMNNTTTATMMAGPIARPRAVAIEDQRSWLASRPRAPTTPSQADSPAIDKTPAHATVGAWAWATEARRSIATMI